MSEPQQLKLLDTARLYIDITLFRRGPEDLPVSALLLVLTMAAYVILTLGLSFLMPASPGNPVGLLALNCGFVLAWYWVVMRLAGRPERFLQTTSAVFGYQAVLAPASMAGSWLFLRYMADPAWRVPASVVLLLLSVWTLAINGRILRSATGWPMFSCVALVLLQALMLWVVASTIFPSDAAAP